MQKNHFKLEFPTDVISDRLVFPWTGETFGDKQ